MLEESHHYFQKASDDLDLSEQLRDILLTPIRVVKVELVTEDREDRGITLRWTRNMLWPWQTS
jgi:predicted nucleotidyltransferase